MSKVVRFASRSSSLTYLEFCDAHNPDPSADRWYAPDVQDAEGYYIVAYLGPGGALGGELAEPAGGDAARAGGELADSVTWAGGL